jgi:hypothetical protein
MAGVAQVFTFSFCRDRQPMLKGMAMMSPEVMRNDPLQAHVVV